MFETDQSKMRPPKRIVTSGVMTIMEMRKTEKNKNLFFKKVLSKYLNLKKLLPTSIFHQLKRFFLKFSIRTYRCFQILFKFSHILN